MKVIGNPDLLGFNAEEWANALIPTLTMSMVAPRERVFPAGANPLLNQSKSR